MLGISAVKKEIATLEGALQKLSEQEAKYSAELDEALEAVRRTERASRRYGCRRADGRTACRS